MTMIRHRRPTSYMSSEHFLPSYKIYDQIPNMQCKSVLPKDGMDAQRMPITRSGLVAEVWVRSEFAARTEQKITGAGLVYRLMCVCPECGCAYPLGKMGQHYKSKRCLKLAGRA